MAAFLETFFETFYTFPKRTTINVLLQKFFVVGFELMMNIFATGTDHGGNTEALSLSPPACWAVAAQRASPYFEANIHVDKNSTNGKFMEFPH